MSRNSSTPPGPLGTVLKLLLTLSLLTSAACSGGGGGGGDEGDPELKWDQAEWNTGHWS